MFAYGQYCSPVNILGITNIDLQFEYFLIKNVIEIVKMIVTIKHLFLLNYGSQT